MEHSKETAIKKLETEEVTRLQRQVLSLEDQLADKTKVSLYLADILWMLLIHP